LNGKIVLALEGGYDFESLSCSCAESVNALLEGRAEDRNIKQKYEEVNEETWKVINQVCDFIFLAISELVSLAV